MRRSMSRPDPKLRHVASLKAPQPPLLWNHTPEQVEALTKSTIDEVRSGYDKIAALPVSERTFESVFVESARLETHIDQVLEPLGFYQNVSTSSELRDASTRVEVAQKEFDIERKMRVDLFEAMKDAEKNIKEKGVKLTPEDERLVHKMILDGKRAGLDLSPEKREELGKVCSFPTSH